LVIALILPLLLGSNDCQAQNVDIDSLQAFIEDDKDCGDFTGLVDAQSHYRALQIILADDTADPHRLDADNNGYACEGLEYNRKIVVADGWWARTIEVLHSVQCEPFEGIIEIEEYEQRMRDAPFNQQNYLPTINEADCLDTFYEIWSYQQ
jgi:hypothetical protein